MLTFRADECHHSLLRSKIMRPGYEMGADAGVQQRGKQ